MEKRLQVVGWLLFLLCSLLFLASGIRNSDPWSIAASALFGVGVVLFLVTLRPGKER
jgi:hypothetical protein